MKLTLRIALVLSLAANLALVAHLAFDERPAAAGTPSGNGDVNGDGGIDVADPLFLLFHLFRGGPAPEPIDAPSCPAPVLATTQDECFDDRGAEILCSSSEFPGQDGFYRRGCGGAGRFIDNQDGTVTDTCTGLLWTRHTQDINADLKFDSADLVSWQSALKFCHDLQLAGRDDWRLANLRELQSLGFYTELDPSLDPAFNSVAPHLYWSSTSDSLDASQAWFIEFAEGGPFIEPASKAFARFHVLAVTDTVGR